MDVVPDTGAVVDGRVSERIRDGEYAGTTVVVPEAVLSELEAQANADRATGREGLAELQRLVELADDGEIDLTYDGERPTEDQIRRAAEGGVDALVRDLAAARGAVLLTTDEVQRDVARARGIEVDFVAAKSRAVDHLGIEDYFDDATMSVHLKAGTRPMAKRGEVGDMHYQPIGDTALDAGTVRELGREVVDAANSGSGFLELEEPGMRIVQYGEYRVAVASPPFSDDWEVTAVRPVVQTDLEDYEYSEELKERLRERQRGVMIAGSPGAGKTTLAQAVGEFLVDSDYSVKTMEKPRDLQVGPEITQYTALAGDMAKTADSLLMVRPDYTIYDEVRSTDDFEVYGDMRLAGVGMVGVVHATRGIDAIQRLIGRVELGLIPQIVDTIVYIEDGEIETVYDVTTEVKVPQGLMEEDLARPVILIRDFETGRADYEIYTFNNQVVTVPLTEGEDDGGTGVEGLAAQEIEREIQSLTRGSVHVEVTGPNDAVVYVPEDDISHVIGKGGGRISDVEERLGVSIDVRTHDERPDAGGGGGRAAGGPAGEVVTPEVTNNHIVLPVTGADPGDTVEVQADGEYLFTATVSRGGDIQVSRGSAIAEELERALDRERTITVV